MIDLYLGMYKTRSARTNPTGKSKLEAGTNGIIVMAIAINNRLFGDLSSSVCQYIKIFNMFSISSNNQSR